jgi:hypothetical protein
VGSGEQEKQVKPTSSKCGRKQDATLIFLYEQALLKGKAQNSTFLNFEFFPTPHSRTRWCSKSVDLFFSTVQGEQSSHITINRFVTLPPYSSFILSLEISDRLRHQ